MSEYINFKGKVDWGRVRRHCELGVLKAEDALALLVSLMDREQRLTDELEDWQDESNQCWPCDCCDGCRNH